MPRSLSSFSSTIGSCTCASHSSSSVVVSRVVASSRCRASQHRNISCTVAKEGQYAMRICRRCRWRSEAFHTNLFEGVPRDDTCRALQPPRPLFHSLPCAETHSAVEGTLAWGEASGVAAMARRTERMERRKSARSSSFLQRSIVLRLGERRRATACTARCDAASPRWESCARRCDREACLRSRR